MFLQKSETVRFRLDWICPEEQGSYEHMLFWEGTLGLRPSWPAASPWCWWLNSLPTSPVVMVILRTGEPWEPQCVKRAGRLGGKKIKGIRGWWWWWVEELKESWSGRSTKEECVCCLMHSTVLYICQSLSFVASCHIVRLVVVFEI